MTESSVKLAGTRKGILSGAVEAIQAVADGRATARGLLEGCLEAIDQDNGKVNAVVHLDVEGARSLADARDDALRAGRKTGPLHGLPVTIKECFDVEGMPTTWGVPALASAYPSKSAGVARRLAEAGAVLIGKTNIPARLGDWETDNPLFGGTRNPHDLSRSAGGSSGGSAAAVACGFSYADIGSDQGGSIRLPAHYCGVNGLKPTWGILPTGGHSMLGETRMPDIGVAGPIARKAEDLSLLVGVLAGSEEPDTAWRLQLRKSRMVSLKGLRFGAMMEHEACPVDAAYLDALNRFLERLEAAGALVDRNARPAIGFNDANNLMNLLVRAETSTRLDEEQFLKSRKVAEGAGSGVEPFKYINAQGNAMPHRRWLQLHEKRIRICNAWRNLFDRYDFFLCPVSASAAAPFRKASRVEARTIPVNGEELPVLTQHFWFSFASLAYLPANAAPIGTTAEGLPCGVQVIGPKYGDHEVAAASALVSSLMSA